MNNTQMITTQEGGMSDPEEFAKTDQEVAKLKMAMKTGSKDPFL